MTRHTYSARVMSFRQAVYQPRDPVHMIDVASGEPVTFTLTNGCRLLLLRLSDAMSANAIVSVSRSTLSSDLGVAPARITEWIHVAQRFGFLSTVRRGRPGVTAVYQGHVCAPSLVRPGVPSARYARADQEGSTWYARADQDVVREGVPTESATWYALGGSQEGVQAERIGKVSNTPASRRGTDREKPCPWHGYAPCPEDCANHPNNRKTRRGTA